MKSLRLVNIRSIRDSGNVSIKPLTLLLGQNSSGKSTFARFFPLLRQTYEALSREPILWFGRLVDFGSAEEANSKLNEGEPFGFEIEIDTDRTGLARSRRGILRRKDMAEKSATMHVSVLYMQRKASQQAYQFSLRFFGHELCLVINQSDLIEMKINGTDYTEQVEDQFIVTGWSACFPSLAYKTEVESAMNKGSFRKRINDYVRSKTHGKTQNFRISQLILSITQAPLDNLLASFRLSPAGDSIWRRTTTSWTPETPDYKRLSEWVIGARALEILQVANSAFARQCLQLRYITPVRASAQRYYRQQGLALREIDSQGENIAMMIHNMSAGDKRHFSSWMQKHLGFHISTVAPQGHISMIMCTLGEVESGSTFNLADTGFGFSQMLPVLMQLWMQSRPKLSSNSHLALPPARLISIEQPELHLHPRLQSKLADLFVEAIKASKEAGIETRLVIETHSEHIINRIGLRIGKGDIAKEDVSLVIFDKESLVSASRVRSTTYDDDGLINDWPYGFFDAGYQ